MCTWHIQNHQTTLNRVCAFTHSASDHPSTPFPVVPTGRFRRPWPPLSTASTAAPAARSCSTAAVWPLRAAECSGVPPQAPKGSETSTAGGLHPVALHRPPPLQWEKLQSVEWSPGVSSFSTLYSELVQWQPLSLLVFGKTINIDQNCIASWLNGSHYRCWCLWRSHKITRLRTDGTFHNRKSEKGKTVFLRLTYLNHSQPISSILKPSCTPIQ